MVKTAVSVGSVNRHSTTMLLQDLRAALNRSRHTYRGVVEAWIHSHIVMRTTHCHNILTDCQ